LHPTAAQYGKPVVAPDIIIAPCLVISLPSSFAFYLDPTNYNIADNIGSIYMEMKDYQRATYFFRKSLYLYPDYLPAKNHLAEILR
jgi:tetratricopeptide (TPR) repeat protein